MLKNINQGSNVDKDSGDYGKDKKVETTKPSNYSVLRTQN